MARRRRVPRAPRRELVPPTWGAIRAREGRVRGRVCARTECLAAGLEEPEGIWAGLGWEGRRRLRVERGEVVVGRHRPCRKRGPPE